MAILRTEIKDELADGSVVVEGIAEIRVDITDVKLKAVLGRAAAKGSLMYCMGTGTTYVRTGTGWTET